MVLGGENSSHREPFESFVKDFLKTGKDYGYNLNNDKISSVV